MGIGFTMSGPNETPVLGEPQSHRFQILSVHRSGKAIVVQVQYKDATEYNGVKILVYDSISSFFDLVKSGKLDPHFLESTYSPIARFEPSQRGLDLAIKMAEGLK